MEKGAIISDCSKYRYSLWRIWDKEKPIDFFHKLFFTQFQIIDSRN